MSKSHNVLSIMFVLSLNFGQKVVMTDLLYSNLMRDNILYMVILEFSLLRGKGGVKAFFLDFLDFEICYSPVSLLSKMLSYFAQLSAVQKSCP